MTTKARRIIYSLCALAIAGAAVAWLATGSYWYTRFKDAELGSSNEQTGLADAFAETGEDEPLAKIENVNAIGLLPSGPGRASLSVATVSAPAVLVAGGVWWLGRRKEKSGAPHTDKPSAQNADEQNTNNEQSA